MTRAREAKATAAAEPKKAKQKICFVIGPIGEEDSPERTKADWLLTGIIKPVLENEHGYHVVRADEITSPGMINSQVMDLVLNAELAVADLTGENANAFYELAMRHMNEKPTIHVAETGQKIPFDVAGFRTIFYSISKPQDLESAKIELAKYVQNLDSSAIDNPIVAARGRLELKSSATAPERALLSMVENLKGEVESLKQPSERRSNSRTMTGEISGEIYIQLPDGMSHEERNEIMKIIIEHEAFSNLSPAGFLVHKKSLAIDASKLKNHSSAMFFTAWLIEQPWAVSVMPNFH